MSQVAVLSQQCFVHSAHFVESQHSVAVSSQQASAFFELLHEHATAVAIAATIAIAMNTFFIITDNLIGLIQYTYFLGRKSKTLENVLQKFHRSSSNISISEILPASRRNLNAVLTR